jgi:hypothetical protein
MKSFTSLITLSLTLTSLNAFALNQKIPPTQNTTNQLTTLTQNAINHLATQNAIDHLTIASVEVNEVEAEVNESGASENEVEVDKVETKETTESIDLLDAKLDLIDKIINIGSKLWNIVEKGKPVANYSGEKASALPQRALHWDQLSNWQIPKSKIINVSYKNLYGIEVVRFSYRIILLYGGSVNGVGRYIGYASVVPIEMKTAYMYTFNANANVDAVFNLGTSQDPVAGMVLNINWTVETVLSKVTITQTYNLDGLGNIDAQSSSDISSLK